MGEIVQGVKDQPVFRAKANDRNVVKNMKA